MKKKKRLTRVKNNDTVYMYVPTTYNHSRAGIIVFLANKNNSININQIEVLADGVAH